MAVTRTVKAPAASRKKPAVVIPPGAEAKGESLLAPLRSEVVGLQVVDEDSYQLADTYLKRVSVARKSWRVEMYGADDKSGPIPSIRQGLDALYALNRKVDQPLEQLENQLKERMRTFKEAEARQLQLAEQTRQEEVARLARLQQANLEKAAAAPTPQLQHRFERTAQAAQTAIEVIEETPAPQPVQAFSSAVRKRKKWRLVNRTEFAKACLDGTLGPEWLDISPEGTATLDELLKTDPDSVGAYPGIEVYEEIGIVRR